MFFGIHGFIVFYAIRVVTIRAIADNYCILSFLLANTLLLFSAAESITSITATNGCTFGF